MSDSTLAAPEAAAAVAPGGSSPTPAPHGGASRPRLRLAALRDLALLPAVALVLIVGQFVNPIFLSRTNLVNVMESLAAISLVVLGQALVIIAGKMDLSLESTVGLAPGIAAWLILPPGLTHGQGLELPTWLAVPITLLIGLGIGLLNGLLIVRFRLNGFIVTLGMLITLRGLLNGISGGQTFFKLPDGMTYLGRASLLHVPVSVWVCLLCFGSGIYLLRYHSFGRALYAIGGNQDAARAGGIRTDRIVWGTLAVASLLAAVAGLMLAGRLGSVAANSGEGWIFTAFAAAVIGGISLDGGRGTIFGAFTGIVLLYLVQNVLTLAGVEATWINFLNGSIILSALVVSRVVSGRGQD